MTSPLTRSRRPQPSTGGHPDPSVDPYDPPRVRRSKTRSALRALVPLGIAGFVAILASACNQPTVTAAVKDSVLRVDGSIHPDTIVLRLRAGDPNTVEVDVGGDGTADFSFDRQTFAAISVDGAESDDVLRIDHSNGVFTDTEATTLFGNFGNDTLMGDVGNETLLGGPGDDFIDGNQGADIIHGDQGADTIAWDPGDGSDTVDGGADADRLAFNASNASEKIDIAPAADHVRLTRDVGAITMDLDGIEAVDLKMLGGTDVVNVNDTTGTDLGTVTTDLSATGGVDDAAVDEVSVPTGSTIGRDGSAAVASGFGAQVRVVNGSPTDRIHVTGATANDAVGVMGTDGPDAVSVVPDGTNVDVVGATPGVFLQLTTVELLGVDLGAGADTFNAGNGLATLTALRVNGGADADTIAGGDGADVIDGGTGDDFIDGNRGNDTILGGDGTDTVQWDPGDASDVVDGGTGVDRLAFNGSNVGEKIDVEAVGDRVSLTRDVAAITMDLDAIEAIDVRALGGADVVTVGNTTGTDLTTVTTDLSAIDGTDDAAIDEVLVPAGSNIGRDGAAAIANNFGAQARVVNGGAGDRIHVVGATAADSVSVAGTAGADAISVVPDGTNVDVVGATPGVFVQLTTVELLGVGLGAGADTFNAGNGLATLTSISVKGGADADTILGGDGADTLDGGTGDDFIDGNRGNDTIIGGDGADTVGWDPGDGNDVVDGGTGVDHLAFNGSNIGEIIDIAAVGDHVVLTRNVAAITMDLYGIEVIDLRTLGGNDVVTVDDTTGTDLTTVNTDLTATTGTGDGASDQVVVNGTPGPDQVHVTDAGSAVDVSGLPALVHITGAEPALDLLTVNGLAGDDTIDATPAAGTLIQLQLLP